ncbi:MFS transporter [Amycolatopsis sp. CA-128772]|uniref:MFS transporter n=1 Tax=Amycolatopsis sp. CA-128772 TaxID=2073159 RepID=UPI001E30FEB3|nr:MFS transporter [Amycolatopsis sp. CA-128772]
MLTMLDNGVLFLAVPHLSESLGASSLEQLWITDIYGFLIAGFLVTMGTLGDRIGRRRLLLIGAAAFGLLSIVAAYSTSPEMLIVARALMGVAGATIMPSTLALIMNMFPNPKQMGAAIGIWSTAMMAGVALGPVIGGALLNSFWWGSVFLIGVPVMVLLLAVGPFLLPESKNPHAGRVDLFSVALSLAAILPFIYGLKELARSGAGAVQIIAVVVGVVFGIVFVLRQRSLDHPLLDIRLFAIPAVSGSLILSVLVASVQGGAAFLLTQHMQLVDDLSPLAAGLWMLVPSFALIMGIQVVTGLSAKVRPAFLLIGGALVSAVGMVVLTQISVGGIGTLILGLSLVFLGVSPVGPLVSQLVMRAAPPERAGSAASLASTGGELGLALGIAALGSLATAVYQSKVSVPANVPADVAGPASESIAGAFIGAAKLPGDIASSLLTTAREAFNSSVSLAATVCAVAFAALAVLTYATLRSLAPLGAPGGPPPEEEAPAPAGQEDGQVPTTAV